MPDGLVAPGNVSYDFSGAMVIVTGAAGGIGLEIGRAVVTWGAAVLLVDRDRMVASIPDEQLAELAASIPMGRFGSAGEMAPAVGFLATRDAG